MDCDEALTVEQTKYLLGPVAHQSRVWADSVPGWIIKALPEARMRVLKAEMDIKSPVGLCSDEEVLIVLFGASLDAPISHHYGIIYQVVALRVMSSRGVQVGNVKDSFEVKELSEWQEKLLLELKRKIRSSIIKNFKQSEHGKKKEKQGTH